MTSTLATRQGLLTRSGNRLSAIIQEESETINAQNCNCHRSKEEEKFSEAVDRLDNKTQSLPEIIERIETNTTAAQTLLDHAKRALTRLIRLQEELEFDQEQRSLNRCEVPEMKLAPIPIPKFSGKLWEWETFWKSFDHTVNSRNSDNLFKFNYLLDALEGGAEESVKHFEVSGSTYQLVIEQLKEKYGDKQALIDQFLKNLHGARARTDSLKDQEPLCEQLHSITSQLTLKGEHVDNVFLQMGLLAKFSVDVQGHILRQRTQLKNEGNWSTAALLSAAKQHIKTELKINRQVEHSLESGKMEKTNAGKKEYFSKTEVVPRVALCFYCHKKSAYKPDTTRPFAKNSSALRKPAKPPLQEVPQKQGTKPQLPKAKTSKINTVTSNDGSKGKRKASDAVFRVSNTTKVLILAGQARVLNPTTKALEPVYVILDTGADRSFISSSLAERLQLKDLDSSRLSIGTFGAQKPFERTCGITVLHMWDAERVPHTFTVTKIDTTTKPLTRSRLSQEDKQFLFENDIHLSINHTVEKIQPDILLGCADLFSLLKDGLGAQTTFPLKAIPSRLGYLISGRSGEELVNSESSTWEQFCQFEKSGVKEFSGPITEELKQTNAEAWKAFEETIEKKEDGYYVRLPWKKEASGIPDNKSIAYRRLQANLFKFRNDPNLLQQYDDTIKSQLELGIIEEIAEDLIVEEGEVVHYLAH
ncbi:hypothetical protein RB195_019152 [Necator americanus]|uniref:Tas retrotransposon peptidase A16 n=1 Tax=Necator americanus TaxID=51031 RepID=A0ABR1CDW3_NECAM